MPNQPRPLRLATRLEPRGPAAAIVLSDEEVAALGGATKTPAVTVTINGATVPARVGRMGGENLVGLSRKLRSDLGVEIGQDVHAEIELDADPRPVDVPAELSAALDGDPAARAAFDGLAASHRKEFARWVGEAKREETRRSRIEQTLTMVKAGQHR
ncbi:MAG: DUF1905 domain-containing protein [Actinobacteria bacterium]|nr:DUF1905 domain-containing protein [Actinomycetota bacterium]